MPVLSIFFVFAGLSFFNASAAAACYHNAFQKTELPPQSCQTFVPAADKSTTREETTNTLPDSTKPFVFTLSEEDNTERNQATSLPQGFTTQRCHLLSKRENSPHPSNLSLVALTLASHLS